MDRRLTLSLLVVLALIVGVSTVSSQAKTDSFPCQFIVTDGSIWNSKTFQLSCDSSVRGWVKVDFGDGGDIFNVEVPESGMTPSFSHDYPWSAGPTTYKLKANCLEGGDLVAQKDVELSPYTGEPICTTTVETGSVVNEKIFLFTCTNVAEGEWGHLEFGDTTQTDVEFSGGVADTSHFYGYTQGEIVHYTANLDLRGFNFSTNIAVDDRPGVGREVFLPVIYKLVFAPTCTVKSELNVNSVKFTWTWENAFDKHHLTVFGDGTDTEELNGPSGTQTVSHDYSWPGGEFTTSTVFEGPGGSIKCEEVVIIKFP